MSNQTITFNGDEIGTGVGETFRNIVCMIQCGKALNASFEFEINGKVYETIVRPIGEGTDDE